jgi:cytoskeleton protein RodZ
MENFEPWTSGETSGFGEQLQAGRRELGLTLEQVAERTRIRKPFIEALEAERVRELPGGDAYVIGFIKIYARLLGLDAEALARQYRQRGGVVKPTRDVALLEVQRTRPGRRRGLGSRRYGVVLLMLAAVLVLSWWLLRRSRETVPVQVPGSEAAADLADYTLPQVTSFEESPAAALPPAVPPPRPVRRPVAPAPTADSNPPPGADEGRNDASLAEMSPAPVGPGTVESGSGPHE